MAFDTVRRSRNLINDPLINLRYLCGGFGGESRFSIIVSRAGGLSAVRRNTLRRWVYSSIQETKPYPPLAGIFYLSRSDVARDELSQSVKKLLKTAHSRCTHTLKEK